MIELRYGGENVKSLAASLLQQYKLEAKKQILQPAGSNAGVSVCLMSGHFSFPGAKLGTAGGNAPSVELRESCSDTGI